MQRLVLIMATAVAFSVALIYFNQPLLPTMGATFGRTAADAGLIATMTQLGYASGLVLFVPLGDRLDRKRLIVLLLIANMLSLATCAVAPSFATLIIASFAIGITGPTAQLIIPAVASLAAVEQRGRTVGVLISGLSAGLLLGRTVSGLIATHAGWRGTFAAAIIIDLAILLIVRQMLPAIAPTTTLPYPKLLHSLWQLFRDEPVLRVAAGTGFLLFAAFSALWGTLAQLLTKAPYGFGPATIGAFGLIGIAGLLASPVIGRVIDKLGSYVLVSSGAAVVILAFAFVSQTPQLLALLLVGMALLNIGNRMGVVANQVRIYTLDPGARSRLNTVFTTSYFLGGATGTAIGAVAGANDGWAGLGIVGVTLASCALLLNIFATPKRTPVPISAT
jgi:predicted MFS family arabinose efflux permease